jgi:hypothetical protein
MDDEALKQLLKDVCADEVDKTGSPQGGGLAA